MTGVDPAIVDLVKAQKAQRSAGPAQYEENPHLAFIVHSFNRISNLNELFTDSNARSSRAHRVRRRIRRRLARAVATPP